MLKQENGTPVKPIDKKNLKPCFYPSTCYYTTTSQKK
jgi:hypothetical protein